jgi:hypothetical protein
VQAGGEIDGRRSLALRNGEAENFGYGVRYLPVGSEDEATGPPTQMAIFERESPREPWEESS